MQRVSERNQELFHYTTVDAFKSIYMSQRFWATHYEQMTDSSELTRFRLVLSEFIAPYVRRPFKNRMLQNRQLAKMIKSDGGIDAVVHEEARMIANTLHEHTFGQRGIPDTFIFSFCAHNDEPYAAEHGLLSQWRSYGTNGVAVVFDTAGIENRMSEEHRVFSHPVTHIGDVTYDDDPNINKKPEFRKVFNLFPEILEKLYSRVQPPYEQIFLDFIMGSTLTKHHAFHEEAEVRIVISLSPTNPASPFYSDQRNRKPIKCRLRGGSEVQYIELFGDAPLPIKRVIVGPSRVQNFNYQSVKEILACSRVEVVKSATPFVG